MTSMELGLFLILVAVDVLLIVGFSFLLFMIVLIKAYQQERKEEESK